MDSTSQFVLAILTILSSGVASAAVTYKLNTSRSEREFKREKLETLFQAIHGHCKTIRTATAAWPLVLTGEATNTTVLAHQNKIYLDSPADIDRCTLLVALYFRELETDLDLIVESGSALNAFTQELAQKERSPHGPQYSLEQFNCKLDRFVEKESAMKQRISEMARKWRT